MAPRRYVIYVRHKDSKLQREVKAEAAMYDLTVSEYAEVALQFFQKQSKTTRKKLLSKVQP